MVNYIFKYRRGSLNNVLDFLSRACEEVEKPGGVELASRVCPHVSMEVSVMFILLDCLLDAFQIPVGGVIVQRRTATHLASADVLNALIHGSLVLVHCPQLSYLHRIIHLRR